MLQYHFSSYCSADLGPLLQTPTAVHTLCWSFSSRLPACHLKFAFVSFMPSSYPRTAKPFLCIFWNGLLMFHSTKYSRQQLWYGKSFQMKCRPPQPIVDMVIFLSQDQYYKHQTNINWDNVAFCIVTIIWRHSWRFSVWYFRPSKQRSLILPEDHSYRLPTEGYHRTIHLTQLRTCQRRLTLVASIWGEPGTLSACGSSQQHRCPGIDQSLIFSPPCSDPLDNYGMQDLCKWKQLE